MNKQEYTIVVFSENHPGLLNRVTIVFTRRKINIDSITVSDSEVPGVSRYTILVNESEATVKKIAAQLEKQIEVFKAFYYSNEGIVYQEMAMYKIATKTLTVTGGIVERIVRRHSARVLAVEPEYTIIESTGYPHQIQKLFDELEPIGILEFVRSGRVAITRPMKVVREYIREMEADALPRR